MKKKEYMTPTMDVVEIEMATLLTGSGGVTSDGIDFGGTDDIGTLDPEAPTLENLLELQDFDLSDMLEM